MAGTVSYVMIIMILSRLLSLVSTQIYMSFFGVDSFLNIYSYAITIPNTIFNCLGTALGTVFIPIYAGHLAKGEDEQAARFANNIITISLCLYCRFGGDRHGAFAAFAAVLRRSKREKNTRLP